MKAMILAAGNGVRLRPFTNTQPKVLAPLNGVPQLQLVLNWLRVYGISEVAINLHHLGEQIADFCGDGSKFDMRITYSKEEQLLGTAGGVKKLQEFFDDTFIVVYGDILTDLNLNKMIMFHRLKKSFATILVQPLDDPRGTGIIQMREDGQIIDFVEKPPSEAKSGALTNAAIYILEKGVFDYIQDNDNADFGHHIFPELIRSGIDIFGYILSHNEYLIDIGNWKHYQRACEDIRVGKVNVFHDNYTDSKFDSGALRR